MAKAKWHVFQVKKNHGIVFGVTFEQGITQWINIYFLNWNITIRRDKQRREKK